MSTKAKEKRQSDRWVVLALAGVSLLMSYIIFQSIKDRLFSTIPAFAEVLIEDVAGGQAVAPVIIPGVETVSVKFESQKIKYPIKYLQWRGLMATYKVPTESLQPFALPSFVLAKSVQGTSEILLSAMTYKDENEKDLFSEVALFVRAQFLDSQNRLVSILHPLFELTNHPVDLNRSIFLYHFPKVLSEVKMVDRGNSVDYQISIKNQNVFKIEGKKVLGASGAVVESSIASRMGNEIVLSKFDMEHRLYGDSVTGGELLIKWGHHPLGAVLKKIISGVRPSWYRFIADGYGALSKPGLQGTITPDFNGTGYLVSKKSY